MDMDSILGTIFRAILNYKRVPMSTLNGPLAEQILTVAHMIIPYQKTITKPKRNYIGALVHMLLPEAVSKLYRSFPLIIR